MNNNRPLVSSRGLLFACLVLISSLLPLSSSSQPKEHAPQPVAVSAQMENEILVYRVNGKRVEDSQTNSLLINLERILQERGSEVPVFIIIDIRAPFSEVGKLETALDKVGMAQRRLFVTNFRDRTMNEIHWDETPIPMPEVAHPN
jgi:biopolymer transport protein ExbD